MKLIKTTSGNTIKISKREWEDIGKTAGWMKTAEYPEDVGISDNSMLPRDMSTKSIINVPRAQARAWSLKAQVESLCNGLDQNPLNDEAMQAIKTVFTSIENTVGMLRDMIR